LMTPTPPMFDNALRRCHQPSEVWASHSSYKTIAIKTNKEKIY
jgi:hypothetical protein